MGDHYAPQKYLRGFCDTEAKIWVFDRLKNNTFRTTLRNIAQENGFYSPEDERDLNEFVEIPANSVLDKLRTGVEIGLEDREKLAFYISTFIYRVPYNRELAASYASPDAFAQFVDRVAAEIKTTGAEIGTNKEKIDERLKQVEEFREKYAQKPAEAFQDKIRSPWPSLDIFRAIMDMKWQFYSTSGPSCFLTSDNPVFFFSSKGLATDDSEMSFPVSSTILLRGCWQNVREGRTIAIPQKLVKEMNRRTASKSTRFLFYHKQEDWVARIGAKAASSHRLNLIRGEIKGRMRY